jgi:alpha-glucosidase
VETRRAWWRHAVVYQIYVRSFADGNGDGTGDIAGMRSRLPHLERLGIDAVWINPWYRSPLLDGGYDVADYREINEQFGTTSEAEAFIAEARSHGIRVLVDLVPNHTSWDHVWFRAALAATPGSDERARYHFLDGRGDQGELPPNDWQSVFGGSAWTRVPDGQWYLHIYDESQPDLNWDHPVVADEFDAVMRFWLDRGAAGFRVDVAHGLVKAPGYADAGPIQELAGMPPGQHPFIDRDEHPPDRAPVATTARRVRRRSDDGRRGVGRRVAAPALPPPGRVPPGLRLRPAHGANWDAGEFASIIAESVRWRRLSAPNPTWVLSNHDVVRHATRYGLPNGIEPGLWLLDGPIEPARRGAWCAPCASRRDGTFALPGSAYVYQGDELGLPEAWDLPSTCCRTRSGTTRITR